MPKIDTLTAYVATGEDGQDDEGVMAYFQPGHGWIPMVGADMDRVRALLPIAEKVAAAAGKPYRVLEFSVRRDVTAEVKAKLN
jgi:hypothetical protein